MDTKHLNQYELAKRWTVSQRTLERWRWARKGPAYLKIGGRVAYELTAVEAFEDQQRHLGASSRAEVMS
ncbi:MAG: helix-turn-helix transcriptional regulator [Thermomicrobiales bacterium]